MAGIESSEGRFGVVSGEGMRTISGGQGANHLRKIKLWSVYEWPNGTIAARERGVEGFLRRPGSCFRHRIRALLELAHQLVEGRASRRERLVREVVQRRGDG